MGSRSRGIYFNSRPRGRAVTDAPQSHAGFAYFNSRPRGRAVCSTRAMACQLHHFNSRPRGRAVAITAQAVPEREISILALAGGRSWVNRCTKSISLISILALAGGRSSQLPAFLMPFQNFNSRPRGRAVGRANLHQMQARNFNSRPRGRAVSDL